jgi:hypothetical protein
MKEKVDIIARLKKGETGRALAEKYGVGTSTISDVCITFDISYVNHPDICLSGPPLTLISPDNLSSTVL